MVAVVYNAREVVAVLLRHGADYKIVDHKGLNILHYIALFATTEMIRLFTGLAETGALAGINITRQTYEGLTPLQAFTRRSTVTHELGGYFERLLDVLFRYTPGYSVAAGVAEPDGRELRVNEEGGDEFHDALESHDPTERDFAERA